MRISDRSSDVCSSDLTHAGLGRLLGQRTVGVDVDPHLSATLHVTSPGDTSRLALAVGHVVTLDGLEDELTEVEARATLGRTGPLGVVLLAVLDATGHQHGSGLPRARSGRGSGTQKSVREGKKEA